VGEIGLEILEALAERFVVVQFQGPEWAEPGDERVAESAIELETPLDFRVALFAAEPVVGRQDAHGVAPEPQGIHHGLATEVMRAGVVRGIQVDQGQDLQGCGGSYAFPGEGTT
jgi:hypothetical protein